MEEQQKERQNSQVQQDLTQTQPPHVQAPAEHQAEQPQNQHAKWTKTRKGEEKNQPRENGRVTVENPTERELIGRPIIRGRRKGPERLRYDTAVRNVEAIQRTNLELKKLQAAQKIGQNTMEQGPQPQCGRQAVGPVEHFQPSDHELCENDCPREGTYSHRQHLVTVGGWGGGGAKGKWGWKPRWGPTVIGFCELQRLVVKGGRYQANVAGAEARCTWFS